MFVYIADFAERCPTAAWDMKKFTLQIPYATEEAIDATQKTKKGCFNERSI